MVFLKDNVTFSMIDFYPDRRGLVLTLLSGVIKTLVEGL